MTREQLELLLRYIDRAAARALGHAQGGTGFGMAGSAQAAELEHEKNMLRQAFNDAERGVIIEGEFTRIGD